MELELRLHPDDAGRLTRLRSVATCLRGRARVQRQRPVWYDTPGRALGADGLSLAEERGTWRLERLVPGEGSWLPAAPPPVLERAADLASFDHALPAPLAPVASFDGRLASYALSVDETTVALGLLRGNLRSVADERPVCRIILAGDEAPVRAVALAIAAELRLDVPPACLAAEGFALAHGIPPPPRRLGAAVLPQGLRVAEAFAHVVGHLTDVIVHFGADVQDPRADTEAVHQMRVGVRRLRSCISVFRPAVHSDAVQAADAGLKALGACLAPARDWDVFVTETAPVVLAAVPDDARLQRLFRAADRRRRDCYAALRAFLAGSAYRQLGIELAWLAAAGSWQAGLDPTAQELLRSPLPAFASDALQRRWRKLLDAAEEIETLGAPGLHGVRLRAKRMRYGAEIFAPAYPGKDARRFLRRLSGVQQSLGELNDVVIAGALMDEVGGATGRHAYAVGLVEGFTAARATDSRARVLDAWDKFRRQGPFWD